MRLTWARPEDLVAHELVQSAAEGKDVAGARDRWVAAGGRSSFAATGGSSTGGTVGGNSPSTPAAPTGGSEGSGPPAWAQRMKRNQSIVHGTQTAAQVLRSGDSHGGGHSVDLSGGE